MRIVIYGAGAVGLGIASCLLKAKEKVFLVARGDTVAALRKNGLERSGIFGNIHIPPGSFCAAESLDELPGRPYDYLLVTTKSFDSRFAAEDISQHTCLAGENTRIVLFQNGWGNAEIFASFFPRSRVFNARVITGFSRLQRHHVVITVHAEPVRMGSLFGISPAVIEDLRISIETGGIPCELTSCIGKELWAKMLYNCALNPLGAICGVPYGKLVETAYSRDIMEDIIKEIFQVMGAYQYTTHWPDAEKYLETFYTKLVPATKGHESSMLQDMRAGKKTEIDALNGAVMALAHQAGVEVSGNTLVYNIVKLLEEIRRGEG